MKAIALFVMAGLVVVPDLDRRLAQWKPLKMPYNSAGLSARDRQLVSKLVEASQYLESIYWRQSDPQGLKLYLSLANTKDPVEQKVRRMLMIQGSRFDLLDHNKPFVGTQPIPPGRGFYDPSITQKDIEAYAKAHPEKREAIYSSFTVIHRRGNDLVAVPFHQEYASLVGPASKALREAAGLTDDPLFAKYLRLRADALLTDDYYESDLAWLDLKDPKFDVILGPYEVYTDGLLGVKAAYEGAVLIRNEEESRKLALFAKYVPDIQDVLPIGPEDRPSKRGLATPMEVMDSPYRSGDARHGYQAVATNLPNDPRVHEKKGTKKIFFKNFMDARVTEIILPVAQRLIAPAQANRVTGEGYLTGTLMHEISHGLGPSYARVGGKRVDIREALGPLYSGLEEAKADVTGLYGLKWMTDKGYYPKDKLEEAYISYVGGIFRTLRFGTAEAHGQAELMEFNYLSSQKAILQDASGRYSVDLAVLPGAIARLTKELLEIEATGDRARGEKWLARYSAVPAPLSKALASITSIPVDIEPLFDFPDNIH